MDEIDVSRVGRHLKSWFTGRAVAGAGEHPGASTVVLQDVRHLEVLQETGVVGAGSLVLVPEGAGAGAVGPVTVVGYDGSFSDPGSDISVADTIFVQTQDYATSPYMTLVGSTVVRIVGDEDFEAFLADADCALTQGAAPVFAVSPAVQIADLTALGVPAAGDGPGNRLYVAASGELSTSPWGLPLGRVGDRLELLEAEWERVNAATVHPCAVALGRAVEESARVTALDERPWLGRYLEALDLQRELAGRGVTEVRVSGFGGRLVPDLADRVDLTAAAA